MLHSSDAAAPQMALVFVPQGAPIAPVLIDVPYVGGVGQVGQTLTCTTGNWENAPTSYEYKWLKDSLADEDTAGVTANTYVVKEGDVGKSITCVVTATNDAGSATAPPSNAVEVTG